jgi:mxaJ protein
MEDPPMKPAFRLAAAAAALSLALPLAPALRSARAAGAADTLQVCADADYLPFSNQAGEGFENKIAEFVAKAMGRNLEYHWASYRGPGGFSDFLAVNLDAGKCDAVMNLPYGDVEEGYTDPYYISSYVFVQKKSAAPVDSMQSPSLRAMKIGFESDTAPETALKIAGLTENAVEFHVADSPDASPKSMLQAVDDGRIGVLITWEPAIGYFLKDYPDLAVTRVPNQQMGPGLPSLRYTFAMAMGVRKNDTALKDALDAVIKAHRQELDAILAQYGVKTYASLAGQ